MSPSSPERRLCSWPLAGFLVTCGLAHLALCNNVLLPKRLVAQIGSKVNLQFSDNEIENAFMLGKDMVTRNTRLENDLVREGMCCKLKVASAVFATNYLRDFKPIASLYFPSNNSNRKSFVQVL